MHDSLLIRCVDRSDRCCFDGMFSPGISFTFAFMEMLVRLCLDSGIGG